MFSIPEKVAIQWLSLAHVSLPHHLAYVEWFTPFSKNPNPNNMLYQVQRSTKEGERLASIIPVTHIRRSAHLFPKFGPTAQRSWKSSNVLDLCTHFFVNATSDRHMYAILY